MKYFGGIEGGATRTKLIICQENGELVAETNGLGTNHWMIGIPECARRIVEMVNCGKEIAGIPKDFKLSSLGLSLSGCEEEEGNRKLEEELQKHFPNVSESYYICSDTIGSLYTASDKGGLVVIAGTGSNTLLRNPDGSTFTCGGWGHILGDEGSAWYIANRAIKICFDHKDKLKLSPYPIEPVWELIKLHFKIETRLELLSHCYGKFEKSFYAGLCEKLSHAANKGDALSKFLFNEAGEHIAKNIKAVLPLVNQSLVDSGDLLVVCVGSVWKSWELIKDGFISELRKSQISFDLSLIITIKSISFGACYVGADNINFHIPRNYADHFQVFYIYNHENEEED